MSKSKRDQPDLNFIAPLPLEGCIRRLETLHRQKNHFYGKYIVQPDMTDPQHFRVSLDLGKREIALHLLFAPYEEQATLVYISFIRQFTDSAGFLFAADVMIFFIATMLIHHWLAGVVAFGVFGCGAILGKVGERRDWQALVKKIQEVLSQSDE